MLQHPHPVLLKSQCCIQWMLSTGPRFGALGYKIWKADKKKFWKFPSNISSLDQLFLFLKNKIQHIYFIILPSRSFNNTQNNKIIEWIIDGFWEACFYWPTYYVFFALSLHHNISIPEEVIKQKLTPSISRRTNCTARTHRLLQDTFMKQLKTGL